MNHSIAQSSPLDKPAAISSGRSPGLRGAVLLSCTRAATAALAASLLEPPQTASGCRLSWKTLVGEGVELFEQTSCDRNFSVTSSSKVTAQKWWPSQGPLERHRSFNLFQWNRKSSYRSSDPFSPLALHSWHHWKVRTIKLVSSGCAIHILL